MAVDFDKPPNILVIHGVQRGDDDDLTQHETIKASIAAQLDAYGIECGVDIFKYEDINDRATFLVKKALAALTGNMIAGWVVGEAVDIVGDVAIALSEGDVYEEIKSRFRDRILESFEDQRPLFIIAHSLGSIYGFDTVNDLMKEADYFKHNRTDTRPVQGLLTIGSPLALDLFDRDWQDMTNLVPAGGSVNDDFRLFPWRNYWDPTDPVVSGSIIGAPWNEWKFREKYGDKPYDLGWDVRSRTVITGRAHLAAHVAYWNDANVALGIRQMLARRG